VSAPASGLVRQSRSRAWFKYSKKETLFSCLVVVWFRKISLAISSFLGTSKPKVFLHSSTVTAFSGDLTVTVGASAYSTVGILLPML